MKLIKTTLFSAIITFIRISSGFIASKAIAVVTGPSGVALLGAFSNFITIVLNCSSGAINNGVVKYTAEYQEDKNKQRLLFSTALRICFICSSVIGLPLIIFGKFISQTVFGTLEYENVIRVLGLTAFLYVLNNLLISILNGKSQINTFTIVNTISTLGGLFFTLILVYFYKLSGALYALVISQSVVVFITMYFFSKSDWFSWKLFSSKLDIGTMKNLSHYTIMSIVSMLTVPSTQFILRKIVIEKINLESAGYWQGMMRISDGFLMIITTAMSTYYLPKFASLKTERDIRIEILYGLKIILPTVAVGALLLFFMRFTVIRILFTEDFLSMERLFLGQLVGDVFKMGSWILGYLMLARAMTKIFIICELIFSLTFILAGYLLIGMFGIEGVTLAYALNSILGFLGMVILFRKLLFSKESKYY